MSALFHSFKVRPVITGLGIVGPTGTGVDAFWDAIKSAESAIREISVFDASPYASRIAGEAAPFYPSDWLSGSPGLKFRRCARHTQMALIALEEALSDAGLPQGRGRFAPVHIVMGGGIGGFEIVHDASVALQRSGRATPSLVTSAAPQATAAAMAGLLSDVRFVSTVSTACASGLDAIGLAAGLIRRGEADVVIAGGADSPLSPVPFANLVEAGLASCRNDDPSHASRPFDLKRDSGVISEGACVVILESHGHALSRGAGIYGELLGYANHIDPPGVGAGVGFAASMEGAVRNSGSRPCDIDYINAWGPGHPEMDRIETEAIKRVFGDHAYELSVSSIKGVVGNPFSAAGPMQVAAVSLAIRDGLLPPTANYEYPDPACDLDYIPNKSRPKNIDRALLNAHGVGGGNCSLVMGPFA